LRSTILINTLTLKRSWAKELKIGRRLLASPRKLTKSLTITILQLSL
jgi:hypothetical protein